MDILNIEGSLEAPTRHVIPWREESWYDEPALEAESADVANLSRHTFDAAGYVVALAKSPGLVPVEAMPATIGVHFACHARAHNMGPKALEMLRLIPQANPARTDRPPG